MYIHKTIKLLLKICVFLIFTHNAAALGITPDQAKNLYFDAARTGNTELLRTFHEAGIPLDQEDNKGYSALILSAYAGHKDSVNYLIDAGANTCHKDKQGRTALMGAIFKGEFQITRWLIAQSCDVNTASNSGQTAAMFAALFNRDDTLNELYNNGADLAIVDSQGNSVESVAQSQGSYDIIALLNNYKTKTQNIENIPNH